MYELKESEFHEIAKACESFDEFVEECAVLGADDLDVVEIWDDIRPAFDDN